MKIFFHILFVYIVCSFSYSQDSPIERKTFLFNEIFEEADVESVKISSCNILSIKWSPLRQLKIIEEKINLISKTSEFEENGKLAMVIKDNCRKAGLMLKELKEESIDIFLRYHQRRTNYYKRKVEHLHVLKANLKIFAKKIKTKQNNDLLRDFNKLYRTYNLFLGFKGLLEEEIKYFDNFVYLSYILSFLEKSIFCYPYAVDKKKEIKLIFKIFELLKSQFLRMDLSPYQINDYQTNENWKKFKDIIAKMTD